MTEGGDNMEDAEPQRPEVLYGLRCIDAGGKCWYDGYSDYAKARHDMLQETIKARYASVVLWNFKTGEHLYTWSPETGLKKRA